ncbi:alpha/beta hydrolase [Ramlibacter sp. AW1]|uniref:Alpha/beta hydrolase n=1 Tax=Ramlibacter aurantiacus TaxID=2801330 RepID=A0A936ZPX2_9BURK|nr:alpha/beta hydrolase [Ramlibacter aurantiacus]MBL0420311.1 alpha/beta hydrolase [Ramlibacter aurantiacus]
MGALPRKRLLPTQAGALEYVLSGDGPPHWILFSGAGVTLEGWKALYPDIERLGRVLAWNRFGLGRSARPRVPQTGTTVLATLRELLHGCELQPPYVLVGHSLGGLHANLFARLYPQEVAGVVLVESTHPDDTVHGHGHEKRLAQVLGRLFEVPTGWFRANLEAELAWQQATVRELTQAGPFPPVPLTVVSAGRSPPRWLSDAQAWERRRRHQAELVQLSPAGKQVIARRSGHFPQRTEPQLVLQVLRAMAGCVAERRPQPEDAQAVSPL